MQHSKLAHTVSLGLQKNEQWLGNRRHMLAVWTEAHTHKVPDKSAVAMTKACRSWQREVDTAVWQMVQGPGLPSSRNEQLACAAQDREPPRSFVTPCSEGSA